MDNVRIVRFTSGEDVIAFYEEEGDEAYLMNPMTVFFKRRTDGKALMMMAPWMPLEIIDEDIVTINKVNILTVMLPKQHLIDYFNQVVNEIDDELDEESLRDASPHIVDNEELENEEEDEHLRQMLEGYGEGTKRTIH